MPRFDPDLIAALAEGRLPTDEAESLEREIAENPAAAAELETQRQALAFLGEAADARLSPDERSGLRAAVAEALGITTELEAAAATERRIPWGSLGIAAAALVGLIAVVPVVGLLSTGGGGDDTIELAAEIPPTTDALRTQAIGADEAEPRAGDDGSLLELAPLEGEQFDLTTVEPAAAAPAAADTTSPEQAEAATADQATTTDTATAERVGRISDEIGVLRTDPDSLNELSRAAAPEEVCWIEDTELRADPPPERFVFEYEDGELTVIVYFVWTDGEAGSFRVWGLPECAELVVINGEE